jgi:hypothetical protein
LFTGETFGIVTDAEKWYFMECSLDDQERLRFKLSKPVIVVYDNDNMREAEMDHRLRAIAILSE